MTRSIAFIAALAASAAIAQTAPGPSGLTTRQDEIRPEVTCAECGVIRSVKRIEIKPRITEQDREANQGLVANIPFGGKPTIGSSTKLAREEKPPIIMYELVVRLDDGRFQVVTQEEVGDLHEGDKVKVDRGKVVLRGN